MTLRPPLFAGMTLVAVAAAAATAFAPPASAREPLAAEAHVNQQLIAARVADRIRRECPSVSANMLRAFAAAQALKSYARRQGYSEAEIDGFLKDRAQRQRIYAEAEAYMAARGVRAGDVQSYCALGQAEIAAGSVAGSLIRNK